MMPIVSSTSYIPLQVSLVSTPIPENNTSYVSPNSVPPSVSNVQINNNASNNPPIVASEEEAQVSAPAEEVAATTAAATTSADVNSNAQSTFLTQLISQEVPNSLQQSVQGLLAQYEKLVAYSYVKYKPSDAGIPQSTPASSFGEIIHQEAAPVVKVAANNNQAVSAPAAATPQSTSEEIAPEAQAPAASENTNSRIIILASAPAQLPQATSQAYVATAARNDNTAASAQELA